MLETILFARDKWLDKEKGIIMPDKFSLYMAGFEDSYVKSSKVTFWKDVYGIDMECLGNMTFVEPLVEHIPPKNIVTNVCKFFEIDLYTCKKEDASFSNTYCLQMMRTNKIDGLVCWFDVEFERYLSKYVRFTTGPYTTLTHWKQTIFYIDGEYDLEAGDELYGSIAVRKNKHHPRELDIKLSFNCRDSEGVDLSEKYVQYFLMT